MLAASMTATIVGPCMWKGQNCSDQHMKTGSLTLQAVPHGRLDAIKLGQGTPVMGFRACMQAAHVYVYV